MIYTQKHYSWFSIIEVMVGIFIFTMGLISIYALLVSSLKVSDYNKNAIIAWNLAREQIELLRNIRDTNYQKLNVWNQINPNEAYNNDPTKFFSSWSTASWSYYTIENDFSGLTWFSVKMLALSWFEEWQDKLTDSWMEQYQVCEDITLWRYVDCEDPMSPDHKKTYFYKYLQVQEALYDDGTVIPETFKVTSKVIWFKRWYHEFDIKTLISDWRRI